MEKTYRVTIRFSGRVLHPDGTDTWYDAGDIISGLTEQAAASWGACGHTYEVESPSPAPAVEPTPERPKTGREKPSEPKPAPTETEAPAATPGS